MGNALDKLQEAKQSIDTSTAALNLIIVNGCFGASMLSPQYREEMKEVHQKLLELKKTFFDAIL